MQQYLRHQGWMRSGEHALALEIPGAGNMNRVLRVRLEAEAGFYRAISPHGGLCRHMPELLGQDTNQHLLCLEDLGSQGDMTRIYRSGGVAGNAQVLDALVRWLCDLHALVIEPDGIPRNSAMRSRARTLGWIYIGNAPHDSRPVLLHGDFYPGSWFPHDDRNVMVIDPEFCFVGPAEFDVGVFMAHLIMAGYPPDAAVDTLQGYRPPAGFSMSLANSFAGMEVIRRLLGVAQLPLNAEACTLDVCLTWAHEVVTQ